MKQKIVPWDKATLVELRMFANQVLGIAPGHNMGESTLRAKIRAAYSNDTITILVPDDDDNVVAQPDAPAPKPQSTDSRALRGSSAAADPKVQITIAEVEGAGGNRPVFVGVNGVGMLVPRGKPVHIPYRYFLALSYAIKTVHEQDTETQEITSTDVPSYPMSVNRMPPQEDIDAYLAAEQDVSIVRVGSSAPPDLAVA